MKTLILLLISSILSLTAHANESKGFVFVTIVTNEKLPLDLDISIEAYRCLKISSTVATKATCTEWGPGVRIFANRTEPLPTGYYMISKKVKTPQDPFVQIQENEMTKLNLVTISINDIAAQNAKLKMILQAVLARSEEHTSELQSH